MDLRELWPSRQQGLVGIDLQPLSIRVVALTGKSLSTAQISAMHVQPLPVGLIQSDRIEDIPAAAEELRTAIRLAGIKGKNVAMALPSDEVVRRPFRFENDLTEAELQYQIDTQVQGAMGLSLEEVNVDFAPMPGTKVEEGIELMVAAAAKARVQDFQALAEAAGVTLTVLDVMDLALERALIKGLDPKQKGLHAAVSIQNRQTYVWLYHEGEKVHEVVVPMGEATLMRSLADAQKWDPARAHEAVARQAWPDAAIGRAVQPFVDQLTQAVDSALARFYASSPFHRTEQIQLTGGLSTIDGLKEQMASLAAKGCRLMNPFEGMSINERIAKSTIKQAAPVSAIAVGLAMRGML